MVRFQTVRKLALALPEAVEGTSYGTPAFHVRGKLFCRRLDDDASIVVYVDPIEREELREVLVESWRRRAPRRLVASYDASF